MGLKYSNKYACNCIFRLHAFFEITDWLISLRTMNKVFQFLKGSLRKPISKKSDTVLKKSGSAYKSHLVSALAVT